MKGGVWEGGHRMPFIVKWPEVVKSGSVTNRTVCFTDIFATLAEINGATIPENQAPDSESFLPVLKGESNSTRGPLVIQAGRKHYMIRSGDWKLITGPESGGFSKRDKKLINTLPQVQLYNLKDDIGETNNLYNEHPEKIEQLMAELNKVRGI